MTALYFQPIYLFQAFPHKHNMTPYLWEFLKYSVMKQELTERLVFIGSLHDAIERH